MSHIQNHKAIREAVKKVWTDAAAAPPGQKPTIEAVRAALLDVPRRVKDEG